MYAWTSRVKVRKASETTGSMLRLISQAGSGSRLLSEPSRMPGSRAMAQAV
ncbi:hypothetical protein D9M73_214920 [compost metagenome]